MIKKLSLFFLLLMPFSVFALEKVKFDKCIDGDTASFIYKGESVKFRFLSINTPESTTKKEKFGEEASEYTCDKLKNAKKIEIEFEENSDKKDKYDRYLAYIFADGNFLQEELLYNGLAELKYDKSSYKYEDRLIKAEEHAKENFLGIYSTKEYQEELEEDLLYYLKKWSKKLLSSILKDLFD
ncbi:MAG: thermonuclease family protein [Bacilli bacterium]|nr:thermonuclease family protein [Bacilli bacterium]